MRYVPWPLKCVRSPPHESLAPTAPPWFRQNVRTSGRFLKGIEMANAVKPYRARYVVFHEELVHARIHMLNIIHACEAILVEDARNKYTKRADRKSVV